MASDICPGGVDGRKCCPDCEHTAGACSGCGLAAPSLPPGGEILSALVHAVTGERPAPGTITAAPAPVDPFTEPGAIVYEEPDVLTVSTSEVKTLSTCKRRYFFEYIMGRRPREQGHEAVWGAALHRGLEQHFSILRGGQERGASLDLETAKRAMIAAALSPGIDSQGRPYEPPADPYARAALSAILRAYVEYWWTDETTYEVVAVELPFKLPVKTRLGRLIKGKLCEICQGEVKLWSCPVCAGAGRIRPMREGRMDLVLRERAARCPTEHGCEAHFNDRPSIGDACQIHGDALIPGRTWITEHKSTGWAPTDERYYAGIGQDLQIALYYDAAREMGLTPAGVMYDVIRRPDYDEVKPPPAMKKNGEPRAQKADVAYSNPRHGERPADYEERIYRFATGEDTRSSWFGRRHLPITQKQVTSGREIMHNAVDEIRWRGKTGHWPEIGDRYVCAAPRKVCPWLDVCEGRASAEDDRLYPLKIKKYRLDEADAGRKMT